MFLMTKKTFEFVRFSWLSNCWTNNDFSEWSIFCGVRVRDRLMAVAMKAMHTVSTNSILPEIMLCAWTVLDYDGRTSYWICDFWLWGYWFLLRGLRLYWLSNEFLFKGIYYCPKEIIKILTDKGQFQYLTNLKGPQVGNYLYTTQFLSLR